MPIKVMIVDDHNLVREGLKAVFSQGDEVEVIGEAGSGEEAIEMVDKVKPDVILMDISMPGINGIQATKLIRNKHPDAKIVILTMLDQEGYVYEAIKAGATGYMLKSTSSDELVNAIQTVNEGKALLHPDATAQLLKEFITLAQNKAKDYGLSNREMEVLQLLSEGKTNKEIAKALWISEQTVKTHVAHIFDKLGTSDRTETVARALRSGLVTWERKLRGLTLKTYVFVTSRSTLCSRRAWAPAPGEPSALRTGERPRLACTCRPRRPPARRPPPSARW